MILSDRLIRAACLLLLAMCLLVGTGACPPFLTRLAIADAHLSNARLVTVLWIAAGASLAIVAVTAFVIVTNHVAGVRRVLQGMWTWRWRLVGVSVLAAAVGIVGVASRLPIHGEVDILEHLNPAHPVYTHIQAVNTRGGENAALAELAEYFLQRPSPPSIKHFHSWCASTEELAAQVHRTLRGELFEAEGLPVFRWRPGDPIVWTAPTPRPILFQLQRQAFFFDLLAANQGKPDRRLVDIATAFVEEWRRGSSGWLDSRPFAWNDHVMADRIQAQMLWKDVQRRLGLSSQADELAFLTTLLRHADWLVDERAHNFRTNHGMMQNCALLSVALNYPEFDRDRRWRETAIDRMRQHLSEGVTRRGVFREITPGYHFFATRLVLWFVTRCRQAGVDLDPAVETIARKMLVFCREILNPNRSLPLIADTSQRAVDVSNWPWQHLPEWPELTTLRAAVSQDQEPPNQPTGRLWPESGYFILRVPAPEWTVESAMMFTLRIGPRSRAHAHADGLSLTLFGHGRPLLTGPGYPHYGDTSRRQRLIGTTSQNTVSVDNTSQRIGDTNVRFCDVRPAEPTAGRAPEFAAIQGESRLYEGVLHRRATFFGPTCAAILLVDELSSDDEHVYRQHFRLAAGLEGKSGELGQLSVVDPCHTADAAQLGVDAWIIAQDGTTRPACSVEEQVASFAGFGREVTFVTRLDLTQDATSDTIEVSRQSVIWEGQNGTLEIELPVATTEAYEWTPRRCAPPDDKRVETTVGRHVGDPSPPSPGDGSLWF